MSTKRILEPFTMASAVSMGATFTSTATSLKTLDRAAMQIVCTGTPTGQIVIEGSVDGTTYLPMPGLSLSALIGAPQSYLIDFPQTGVPWIRFTFTRTAGTGTCTAKISAKGT